MLGLRSPVMRKVRGFMMRAMPLMITCRELEEFVVDYLDGALPARQRIVFELHLRMCRECRAELEAYKRTIALGRAIFAEPDAPVGDEVPEDLVKAVLAALDEHP